MDILIAFLVMLAIALIAGISLLVFSHLFSVKEDPKKIEIRECLPGANCGACGFAGCDDYAAALAEGRAKPNLCTPGAQTVANKLGEILGVDAGEVEDVVAFVKCNGTCVATTKTAGYNGVSTCVAASMLFGGNNSCKFGCLGYGDCANVCSENGICLADGIARIDKSSCIGCGNCVEVCPKHIIDLVPRSATTFVMCGNTEMGAASRKNCKNACIGCKKCEKTCPNEAITVANNLASIDYEKCTNCGACVDACPTACIRSLF